MPEIGNAGADPEFYYGEIAQQHFDLLLKTNQIVHAFDLVVDEYCSQAKNTYFPEYVLDPRRALCLKVLGDLHGKRILDYGCGLGSIGIVAARGGADVTFVDSCMARLEACRARCHESGLSDVRFIAANNWERLPEMSAFDHVILNGVLEWIPSTRECPFAKVQELQLAFLRAMGEMLNSGGSIALAIENRFALQYYFGYPEDHTNIPFLSMMRRDEANKVHLEQTGREFVNWTWSLNDYQSLLPQAGLRMRDRYAMFPDYRFPRAIVHLDDLEGLQQGMVSENYSHPDKERSINYLAEMGLLQNFVYSYLFLIESEK
jgi:2-polyprenyl-3-methyl-5-hydroxy-6-metoxy-1,4-benzoquinol methylase